MNSTIQFLPWSSAPVSRKAKSAAVTRPAPKSHQHMLSWLDDGQPVGTAVNGFNPGARKLGGGHCRLGFCGGRTDTSTSKDSHKFVTEPRQGWLSIGLGYLPDFPDRRDYRPQDLKNHITGWIKQRPKGSSFKSHLAGNATLSPRVHLGDTGRFSPVEDQLDIGSCTANAVVGLVEYFHYTHKGEYTDMSRMFLYKCTRRLLSVTGDTGAYIRSTIKALRLFGLPPESRWPYSAELLDVEPDQFVYSYASNFKAVEYASLDAPGTPLSGVLDQVKRTLADGFPVAFGFTVYRSMERMRNWIVPYPEEPHDEAVGGHAVVAAGYDDEIEYVAPHPDYEKAQDGETINEKGALIVRNSWGMSWGDLGYG